jgi:hypothetical protein
MAPSLLQNHTLEWYLSLLVKLLLLHLIRCLCWWMASTLLTAGLKNQLQMRNVYLLHGRKELGRMSREPLASSRRASGNLLPLESRQLTQSIASMVSCCLILHNMGVSDCVMGDARTWYDPGSVVVEQQEVEEQVDDDEAGSMVPQGGGLALQQVATSTSIRAFDIELARIVISTQRQEMKRLTNEAECTIRLQKALISYVNGWKLKN